MKTISQQLSDGDDGDLATDRAHAEQVLTQVLSGAGVSQEDLGKIVPYAISNMQ